MIPSCIAVAILLQDPTPPDNAFSHDVKADFKAFDPHYRDRIADRKDRLRKLQEQLFERASHGTASACGREIYVEAQWLTYNTCDYRRIDAQIEALQSYLARASTSDDEAAQAPDGSYAPCHKAWFYKLDRTCDRLTVVEPAQLQKQRPLKFLDDINHPKRLLDYLNSKLVSDVKRTGVDNGFELNIGGTDLLRLINGHLPSGYHFHPNLRQTMDNWVTNTWQDPQTGFFGAWYITKTGIKKTADLSCTFHVVDYMDGKVHRWPQIIKTTLAMKDLPFPHGWMQEGKLSNHHDYDVVTLFHDGWSTMQPDQRAEARFQIRRMLNHCLKETLNADGSFKQEDMNTVGESFEFPVMFLSEIGYFHRSERFWTDETFPEARELAKRIANQIKSKGLHDPESLMALYLVESAD